MIEICPTDKCTGCGVCAGICPKNCISIKGDRFGYLNPVIDQDSCIDCRLCEKTCPNNRNIEFVEPKRVYAAWSTDCQDRATSSSGGIASVLSKRIISEGGVVYGAVGNGCGVVEHQKASTLDELDKFKKSKYVQSYINRETYHSIKQDIKDRKSVLFIGTPCQAAAVRSMAGDDNNLICIDLICHGVPSQQLFRDHVAMILGNDSDRVTSFTTRDNDGYFLTLMAGNKVLYRTPFPEDQYLNGFQYGLFHRPSCYQCLYAQPQRQSDLTIGDFWGLGETTYPHEKVSVILENTPCGANLLKRVIRELFLEERSLDEAVNGNAQLRNPSAKHEFYDLFRKIYITQGYKKAITRSLRKFYIKNAVYKFCMRIPGFYRWKYGKKI